MSVVAWIIVAIVLLELQTRTLGSDKKAWVRPLIAVALTVALVASISLLSRSDIIFLQQPTFYAMLGSASLLMEYVLARRHPSDGATLDRQANVEKLKRLRKQAGQCHSELKAFRSAVKQAIRRNDLALDATSSDAFLREVAELRKQIQSPKEQ